MIIALALETSTPTSITVVATSTWVSLEEAGEGITGTATVVMGGVRQSGSEKLWLDEVEIEAEGLPLPPSVGALTGNYDLARSHAPMTAQRSGSISWSFTPCGGDAPTLEVDRATWDEVVFDKTDNQNKAEVRSIANKVSQADAARVVWAFPEIFGVRITTDPENAMGRDVMVTYWTLPEDNSDFEVDEPVTASLPGCGETATDNAPARFFFYLDGVSNADPEPVPNWFYYWLQTAAGQGLSRGQVRYSVPGECQDDDEYSKTLGFYAFGDTHINLCDPITGSSWNKVTGLFTDGIDTYASVILHELEHLKHYNEWWRDFNETWNKDGERPMYVEREDEDEPCQYRRCRTAEYAAQRRTVDRDDDEIPDHLEGALGMNSLWYDTNDCKMSDEHYLAWLAGGQWPIGTADKEDWAAPGKQFSDQSAPPKTRNKALCGVALTGSPQR